MLNHFCLLGNLTVGYIHTEKCGQTKLIQRSLDSLFSHTKTSSENGLSVVIVLRDCSAIDTSNFLNKMYTKYKYWIEAKIFQIIKIPRSFKVETNGNSQYWKVFTSHSLAYIKKAKSLIRSVAFLWKFSVSQSDYFIQFTDHVIVEDDLFSSLPTFVKEWTTDRDHWHWAENFQGFLTGSIHKTDSFVGFVELFDILGSQMPLDFMIKFYRNNFRVSQRVYQISKPLPIREDFKFDGDNPLAAVTTSLVITGDTTIQDLYKNRRGFFWASIPKEGDYILVDFKQFIYIKRLLIETGTHLYEDIVRTGEIFVLFGDNTKTTTIPDCSETGKFQALAEFKEPHVDLTGAPLSKNAIGCIQIRIGPVKSSEFKSWVIVRTLAIFTK